MPDRLFRTMLCAVGGARGGVVVPDWFGVLADLGIERAHLLWAMPPGDEVTAELEQLRAQGKRWLTQLRALGVHGELVIKRGVPGPWIAALAGICDVDLVVTGPPSIPGGRSETIAHLLGSVGRPLLLLPDGGDPLPPHLLHRPLVDVEGTPAAASRIETWVGQSTDHVALELAGMPAGRAVRHVLRTAVETEASVLVLAGRAGSIAPGVLASGSIPILIVPGEQSD